MNSNVQSGEKILSYNIDRTQKSKSNSQVTITVLPKPTIQNNIQIISSTSMEPNASKPDPPDYPPPLLTDHLNPKQTSITHSPESTVSFDSSSDRLTKKTRELPNLSDCHSCGVRINHTNPRDRLHPLDSMWRIVLLCKTCTKRVSSSALCPYCFNSVVNDNDNDNDIVKCRECSRSVHKECAGRYGLGFECFVCVDCWIPDAIAKSVRARKRNNNKKKSVKLTEESRVSVRESKRKVVLGVVASRMVTVKARCEKKVALHCEKKVAARCEKKAVDDAELAFLLHREINRSARICRNSCSGGLDKGDDVPIACYKRKRVGDKVGLMNSSGLDASLVCYSRREKNGCLMNSESLNAPLMCYTRRRSGSKDCLHDTECERTDKHGSISSAGLKACNLGSDICHENDVGMGRTDMKPHRYFLKYHRIGKSKPRPSVFAEDSDSCSSMDSDNLCTKGMTDTSGFGNGMECTEVSENCGDNANRFLLKYQRSSRCKSELSCKVEEFSKMLPSNHRLEQTALSNIRPQSS